MYGIDIVSAYIVCGVAALAGAGLLALVQADSRRTAQALRLFMASFVCIGLGLSSFLLAYDIPLNWISNGSASACATGMALAVWGLRELNGYRTAPRAGWGGTAGTLAVMLLAWAALRPLGFGVTFCIVGLLMASTLCATQLRFFAGARTPVELALAAGMAAFALFWLLRTWFTLGYSGAALIHHFYVPEEKAGPMVLAFAAMPAVAAGLLMASINARLAHQLERRTLTDELTGLVSRRGLRELGPQALARSSEKLQDTAVLVLDIDHFSRINQEHGHLVGDDVLRHVAQVCRHVIRGDTTVARYGGEEFAVLIPLDHAAMAGHVAERLRLAVEKSRCDTADGKLGVTVSVGLTLHRTGEPLDKALMRADHLAYQAKSSGRNCICDDLASPIDVDVPVDLPDAPPASDTSMEKTVRTNAAAPVA